jgi:predicted regulator of Ras-like GTPase activity (Roadblock/LC7/MglB family)
MTITVIQEARARDTVGIFTDMADAATTEVLRGDAAEAALAFLTEMSPDLRGAAILDSTGAVLAASSDRERWCEDAAALFAVADRAGEEPAEQAHVATEQGEVFALRQDGLAAVVVTERFALASLMFFDMRSTLRDLATGRRAENGTMGPEIGPPASGEEG